MCTTWNRTSGRPPMRSCTHVDTPPFTYGYVPSSTRQTSAGAATWRALPDGMARLRRHGVGRLALRALADLVEHEGRGQREVRVASGGRAAQQRDGLGIRAPRQRGERRAPRVAVAALERVTGSERARQAPHCRRRETRPWSRAA